MTKLNEREFTDALVALYHTTVKEMRGKYKPTAFLRMSQEHGGLETVRKLIPKGQPQSSWASGFTELCLEERLDLSLEWFILQEPWRSWLVSQGMQENIDEAKYRLQEAEYLDKAGNKR